MASESIENAFRAVFDVHYPAFEFSTFVFECGCGETFADVDAWIAHVAEQLAARLEQVGMLDPIGIRMYKTDAPWRVPVFRVKEQH